MIENISSLIVLQHCPFCLETKFAVSLQYVGVCLDLSLGISLWTSSIIMWYFLICLPSWSTDFAFYFFFLFGFIQIDIWLSQSFILIWLSQSMSLGGVTDLYQSSDLALWFPAIWVQFVKSISWVMLLIYISLSGSYSLISCYMNSVCYYTKYHKLTISLLFFIITLTIWI